MPKKRSLNTRILAFKAKYGSCWSLMFGIVTISVIFATGMVGYTIIEGWSLLDSFYMVVITLSTVGFMEVHPLSEAGRLWTSGLILAGVGSFAFLIGAFSQVLMEGRLQAIWGRRRMQKTIQGLNGHFIVCGYGRIGSIVVREIENKGLPVVVVEQDPELVNKIELEGLLSVAGDATKDEVLLMAGLKKAGTLITALSVEAANVYVTLTARQLNPSVHIVARADEQSHIQRLEHAGANRVVMPHTIGGLRMAQSVLRPTVTNFMELTMRGTIDLQMEELLVSSTSELVGKDLIASKIRPRFNLIIIAIKKPTEESIFNPAPQQVIEAGDTLLAVGKTADLKSIEDIL